MRKLFRSSLRYKIGALMLLLSLVPLVIVSVVVLTSTLMQLADFSTRLRETENSLRSDVVGRNLSGTAADTTADIDGYLLERIVDVRRWSEESIVIEATRQGTLAVQQNGLAGLSSDEIKGQLEGSLFVPITQTVFVKDPQCPIVNNCVARIIIRAVQSQFAVTVLQLQQRAVQAIAQRCPNLDNRIGRNVENPAAQQDAAIHA